MGEAKRRRKTIVQLPGEVADILADQLAERSCLDAALVSTVVWVPQNFDGKTTDVWATYVSTSEKGIGQSEFYIDQIILGPRCGPLDEAKAARREMVSALRRKFKKVYACDTEVNASKQQALLWPGERSRKIEAETIADYASRPKSEPTDPFTKTVMQWPVIPADEPLPILRGRVIHAVVRHDSWCETLNGGTPSDYNCNPEITRHLQPLEL